MPTANKNLRDRGILHATRVERMKARETREAALFLGEKVLPDIDKQIQKALKGVNPGDTRNKHVKRLKTLRSQIQATMKASFNELQRIQSASIGDIATGEGDFAKGSLNSSLNGSLPSGVDIGVNSLSPDQVKKIVNNQPYQGGTTKRWFDKLSRDASKNITDQIGIGLTEGQTIPQIMNRLRGSGGAYGKTRANLEAVTRTAVNHATTQAREQTYAENADIIDGVQYVATLDSRTTTICAGLDGQVFPIDSGPRPPQHFNCRSTTVPITKSFEALGLGEALADSGASSQEITASRASINGQVPEDQTFPVWLKGQPDSVQDEVLGKTKGNLFRKGKVPIHRFTDANNSPLTIKQVLKRENLSPSAGLSSQEERKLTDLRKARLKEMRRTRDARRAKRESDVRSSAKAAATAKLKNAQKELAKVDKQIKSLETLRRNTTPQQVTKAKKGKTQITDKKVKDQAKIQLKKKQAKLARANRDLKKLATLKVKGPTILPEAFEARQARALLRQAEAKKDIHLLEQLLKSIT